MILRGERAVGRAAHARLGLAPRYALANLMTEVAVGSAELAALGLISFCLVIQTIIFVSPGHFRPVPVPALSIFVSLGTLAALSLAFCAWVPIRTRLPLRIRQGLCASAIAALGILSVIGTVDAINGTLGVVAGAGYSNDGAVMDLHAAKQVLVGHNPYQKASISAALADVNAPSQTTTPLMVGPFAGTYVYPMPAAIDRVFNDNVRLRPGVIPPEFESKYNYPAGSFLFILPFVWAGFNDMRLLYVLAAVLMGAYVCWRMPRALRPLGPALVLANVPLVVMTAGGQPDPIYGLFLMVGFAEWPSRWVSPLAMGISIATKQLAWFFLPLYIVLIARQLGWREAIRRAGMMAAVYGAVNLPFILQSPGSYASSLTAPLADPMFPLGVGVVAIFVANLLPMLPKATFTAMEVGAWILSVAGAVRFRAHVPAAAMVALGAIPLFFAWRSLTSYFYLVPLLVAAVLFAERQRTLAGQSLSQT
jgi:hypothetical protein